jgi:uncharacterized protein YbaR (Trm112 family)
MLSEQLLAVLACPKSKRPLVYFPRGERGDDEASAFLLCPSSRLRYRIEAGVPVLLVEEAQEVDARECERLVARARELGLPVTQ